ncbi:superoxide reductase [bacterium]|nr:superoxide reductase [bacterium]
MSENLFTVINRVKDTANPTDLEKKHTSNIEVPEPVKPHEPFEVKITIGKELAHPDEGGHHIQWLELFAGEAFLGRVDFTPMVSGSPVTLTLKLFEDTTLRALTRCNLHGLWEASRNLKVS